jgi:hypothetical protein
MTEWGGAVDFYFLDATEPEDALRKLLTLVTQRSGARPT